ncbi:MAG: hypothetical protein AAF433_17230 [Bacteroidota bacterium]
MKQLFFSFVLLTFACSLSAARFYVAPGASNQGGDSWNAPISLHQALQLAAVGDEIWVKQGTYYSSLSDNREDRLMIPSGVALYGGFSGSEQEISDRKPENTSLLSGDLGIKDNASDNAFTVVYMLDANAQTVLDGFTIAHGQAKAPSRDRMASTTGGALVIEAVNASSSPKIQNCVFANNNARYGGAVYVNGRKASAEPQFVDCSFRNNEASFRGGAIYNDGVSGLASPVLVSCEFIENDADYGAGLYNNGSEGESNPLILESNFVRNKSSVNGAAVYNDQGETGGTATPVIQDCAYIDNFSELGDDIANSSRDLVHTRTGTNNYRPGSVLRPSRPQVAADRN